jgi:hypothetical protein
VATVAVRRKIMIVHMPMDHRTQEGSLGTPVIYAHSTHGAASNSSTIPGMTEARRMVVMLGDGNGNNSWDIGSLDLTSISIVQEQDRKWRMHNVPPTLMHHHSIREEWEETSHSKPFRLHNQSQQFHRFSRIRKQAKPRLKKDHRGKVISLSASDVINPGMES